MTERAETALLRRLIARHHGCLTEIADDFGRESGQKITRAGVTKKIIKRGLEADAATARALAGVTGGRSALPGGALDPIGEKTELLDALATSPNNKVAASRLGVDYRQLYRRRKALGVTAAEVVAHRRKLQANISHSPRM